ncbi:tyrosine-type recombinase/integrase [Desulfolithobacter dissulfuricans]|uniref:tyrosine-type recombinase/integrase n=1 Tax=Desulfolithobacter dissulfuricans TaxID=2795293 RepID=UPI00338F902C
MATIRKRKRKKGTVYLAEVCVNGQRASRSFSRRWEALQWAETTEELLRAGLDQDGIPQDDMLFEDALRRYELEVSSGKRSNSRARETVIFKHLLEFFSGTLLSEIKGPQVASYRDARLRKVKPGTVCREMDVLSHLFTVARLEWGVNCGQPAQDVRRPKRPEGRLRLLDRIEIRMLLDCCCESKNTALAPYVRLQLHTGMRPSEGAGLTWGQVDLTARMIDLPRTKTTRRRVPLTREAAHMLEEMRPPNWRSDQYVFLPDSVGESVRRRPNLFFRRSFENAVAAAEIKDFTMHDLRHTAASYLLMAGVDLRTLAEILGHRTMEMVRRYTHLLDDHKLEAVDRINDLWT